MSKRKFGDFHNDDVSTNSLSDSALRTQQEKLELVLEHSKKAISQALRIARGIERQKLGRRQKTAKEGNLSAEGARLNDEVAALKALDLPAKGELHLYKSMIKSKPIISAHAFPSYILAKVETGTQLQDIAHANVQARLFNSNVVKVAMTNTMDSIRAALGIGNEDSAGKKKRLRAADYIPENKLMTQAPLKRLGPREILATNEKDKPDRQTQSTLESFHGEPDVTRSDDESAGLAAYEDRVADSENGFTSEVYLQRSSTENKELEHSLNRDLSPSPSRSVSSSSSAPTNPKPHKIPITNPKSTIFLPSLAMGGYISGSDSDISDPSSLSENVTIKSRKNRRGQQERRQIWEKKYGRNANHVKNHQIQQQQQQTRDQGWDARKGAARDGGDDRGKRDRGRGRGQIVDASTGSSTRTARARAADKGGVGPISSGANSDPVHARRGGNKVHDTSANGNQPHAASAAAAAESAPLHPSWEAAKRQKEARKNVAFQGKKVVF